MTHREIKFRGKNGDEWLVGDLVHRDGKVYIFPEEAFDSYDNYEVDPSTIGQYTGLKDKDGKEIWEGDVVQNIAIDGARLSMFIVKWHRSRPSFCIESEESLIFELVSSSSKIVIGTIYDNPELCQS